MPSIVKMEIKVCTFLIIISIKLYQDSLLLFLMQDENVLVFSIQYGLPLLNAGGGLTLHTRSGLDIFGTIGVSKISLFDGISIDVTTGYHLGIIGAEGYMRTPNFNSFIQTVPNARQQFFETTGFMWHLR
jgi:hypothetical protein